MFGINFQNFLLILGFSSKETRFSNFGFAKISPFIENKKVFFETISFKKNQNSLRKDRKDAGALKVKKETKRKGFLQVIFLIKSNYLICVFASKPINFIRTFALLATAEYCFSCIALCIAVSRVHTNFAVISGRFKSPSSISSFSKR